MEAALRTKYFAFLHKDRTRTSFPPWLLFIFRAKHVRPTHELRAVLSTFLKERENFIIHWWNNPDYFRNDDPNLEKIQSIRYSFYFL